MPDTKIKNSQARGCLTYKKEIATMTEKKETSNDRTKKPPVMLGRAIVGVVLGGLAGYGLYRYVGCASGACLVTSSPWGSILYCMILGFVASQIRLPGRADKAPPPDNDQASRRGKDRSSDRQQKQ